MYCNRCGKENIDGSKFCSFCGNRLIIMENVESVKETNETVQSDNPVLEETIPNKSIVILEKIIKIGMIVGLVGVTGFLLIALVGLIGWGKVYLYGGYSFTKVLCTIDLVLLIVGLLSCGSKLILAIVTKNKFYQSLSKKVRIISICAISLAFVFSIILISSAAANKKHSSSSSSSSSYEMDHDTYCLLYMKISDVSVTHKYGYAYVRGSIKNTGTYSVKYVKVKASCMDYSGRIVDTDWTYAVDSSWLSPGESKTFEMMIRDDSYKINSATVTITY